MSRNYQYRFHDNQDGTGLANAMQRLEVNSMRHDQHVFLQSARDGSSANSLDHLHRHFENHGAGQSGTDDESSTTTAGATGGNDTILTRFGADTVNAGAGNDFIQSRSDAGEPDIAQATTASKVYSDQPYPASMTNDTLTGGSGADTFDFRIDLNAKADIIAKHVNADGTIDWAGVTGENGNAHDHWLEGIGTDTITDFVKGTDTIHIAGHTVTIDTLAYSDVNGDGVEDTSINLKSDQGAAGAHDEDKLGTIIVLGNHLEATDVTIDPNVTYGVTDTAGGAMTSMNDMMII